MLKLVLVFLLVSSSTIFATEIFKKDAKEFKATINFENGKSAKIVLKAVPKKGWHINDGFPVSFKPKASILQFDKKKYKKKDVKSLKSTELLFEIPVKLAPKGEEVLNATVVLGVCSDTICKRIEFKVNASLESPINRKAKIKKEAEPKKIDIIK